MRKPKAQEPLIDKGCWALCVTPERQSKRAADRKTVFGRGPKKVSLGLDRVYCI